MLRGMNVDHVGGPLCTSGWMPAPDPQRNCYTCTSFGARGPADVVRCHHGGRLVIHAHGHKGCAYWQREAGADAACDV